MRYLCWKKALIPVQDLPDPDGKEVTMAGSHYGLPYLKHLKHAMN